MVQVKTWTGKKEAYKESEGPDPLSEAESYESLFYILTNHHLKQLEVRSPPHLNGTLNYSGLLSLLFFFQISKIYLNLV